MFFTKNSAITVYTAIQSGDQHLDTGAIVVMDEARDPADGKKHEMYLSVDDAETLIDELQRAVKQVRAEPEEDE